MFKFNNAFLHAFNTLKDKLIIELIYDDSGFVLC